MTRPSPLQVPSTVPAVAALLRVRNQAPGYELTFLRRLREAVLAEGRNIARPAVIEAAARDAGVPDDLARTVAQPPEHEALAVERQRMVALGATSFLTLVFETSSQQIRLAGAVPYRQLAAALSTPTGQDREEAPPLTTRDLCGAAAHAVAAYGRATTREIAEPLGLPDTDAHQALTHVASREGLLWTATIRSQA